MHMHSRTAVLSWLLMACTKQPRRQEVYIAPSTASAASASVAPSLSLPSCPRWIDSGGNRLDPVTNDISHAAPQEQEIRTPLPIYVEYTGSERIKKVELHYRGPCMPDFKTIELRRMGSGYGGEVPCSDVRRVGDLAYYIHIYDDASDNVAGGGTTNNPYVVRIVDQVSGSPPHLPNRAPPKQCSGP